MSEPTETTRVAEREGFGHRYWRSLTEADPRDTDDPFVEHGRNKTLPFWRRYLAALLGVTLVAPEPGGAALQAGRTEETEQAEATGVPASPADRGRSHASGFSPSRPSERPRPADGRRDPRDRRGSHGPLPRRPASTGPGSTHRRATFAGGPLSYGSPQQASAQGSPASGGPPPQWPSFRAASASSRRHGLRLALSGLAVGLIGAGVTLGVILVPLVMTNEGNDPGGNQGSASTQAGPTPPKGARVEPAGFAWIPPKGWKRTEHGDAITYTAPDGSQQITASVAMAATSYGLLDGWEEQDRSMTGKRDYHLLRLEQTDFQNRSAAVWEYTYTSDGTSRHTVELAFTEGVETYRIATRYRPATAPRGRAVYDKVLDGFTVL
ncbi:hypothetical protein [Streptomyces guryensis]|uniref:Uncharacterized protein n=1 Tax=Streptomyces guryensis TaxID=2886947 RepID=A0A9Q3VIV1_9ACTN|nr:hypothetical protein [Streptomyces guryensis]MCD9872314.1 hypothetical protein [Streptomyces guryensis]